MPGTMGIPSSAYMVLPKEQREFLAEKVKEGAEFVKKHPEILIPGNPLLMLEGAKKAGELLEKATDSVIDFFKDTIKFGQEHPELLLAKTSAPQAKLFDD